MRPWCTCAGNRRILPRHDFDYGQSLIAENADGQFTSGKIFFDEHLFAKAKTVFQCQGKTRGLFNDMHANAGALARGLNDEGRIETRTFTVGDNMPSSRGNAFLVEARLLRILSKARRLPSTPLRYTAHRVARESAGSGRPRRRFRESYYRQVRPPQAAKRWSSHVDLSDNGAQGLQGASYGRA